MSDREFENYLTLIGRLLRLSSAQREAIGEELRDHFESRLAELVDRGLSHDEAVRMALDEFGDAAGLAADFSSITQTRRRRLIMRCTVGSIAALAAAVIVAMAVWPENHAGRVVGNAVAQNKETTAAKPATAEGSAENLTAKTETNLSDYMPAEFKDVPLTEFLNYIRDRQHVQIYIHENSLTELAVDPTAVPININLNHVRARMLLDLALDQHNLGFMIRDGIVIVATKDWLGKQLQTRVYDCRTILAADNDVPLSAALATESKKHPDSAMPSDKLIDVIRKTIAINSWSDVGGPGTITEYNGLLVVSQTAEVQTQVADLLEQITGKLAAKVKQ